MNCEVGLNLALATDQQDCESPANLEPGERIRTFCYRCGKAACKACSWVDMDPLVGKRTRRCRDCREEEK